MNKANYQEKEMSYPDSEASGLACRIDQVMETVGGIDRAEVGGG